MSPQAFACLTPRPVPTPQQNHVQVEHRHGQRDEVEEARERDHAGAEVAELGRNRPVLDPPPQAGAGGCTDPVQEYRHGAEQGAEDKGHRDVRRQERGNHADRNQQDPHQPVAQIGRKHHPEVGITQIPQHQQMAQRECEGHRVDSQRREVLAQHHVHVMRGQGEKKLVGALPSFIGPRRHRDCRDEEEQHVGHVLVELVEVGQVVGKELGLPERDGRADDHEERDEDVTGGIAEVALQVPLEDGPDHVAAERPGAAVSFRRRGRRLAGRFGLERGHRGNPLEKQLRVVRVDSGEWRKWRSG